MFFRREFFGNFMISIAIFSCEYCPYLYAVSSMPMYVDNPWSLRLRMLTWNIQTNADVFFRLLEYSVERATE